MLLFSYLLIMMTSSHRNVKGFFFFRFFLKMYFQIYSYQKLIIVMNYSHLNSSFVFLIQGNISNNLFFF